MKKEDEEVNVRSLPLSAAVGGSNDPPGRAGQHHAVVDQAQNLDHAIRCQAVDDKVSGTGNAPRRLDALSGEAGRVGTNAGEAGHPDGADHVRLLTQGGHDGQDQLAVPTCCFQTMIAGTVEKEGVDLVFCRPGETIGHYPPEGRRERSLVIMSSCSRRSSSRLATVR